MNLKSASDFFRSKFQVKEDNSKALGGEIIILDGRFEDFSAAWYYNVGSILCITMVLNLLSPFSSAHGVPCFKCCRRCWDRRGKWRIKKSSNPEDDVVNTRQLIQSDLQKMYSDPQIKEDNVYAQLYTTLLVCLMYSSGIPAMYAIGFLFFFTLYWMCKVLLVKFFEKNKTFNESLQLKSLSYLKYGVLFHMAIGGSMYTNSRILSEKQREEILNSPSFQKYTKYLDYLTSTSFMADRFRSFHSKLYFAIFLLIIAVFLIRKCIVGKFEEKLLDILCCKPCRNRGRAGAQVQQTDGFVYLSNDFYKELHIPQLTELYKKSTRELKQFEQLLK